MSPEELTGIVERLRIQHNDDENIEAKKCETKLSNDVWESVSAFGNTSGGLILLGLDQESGFTIPPKYDIDKSIEQFVSGMQQGWQADQSAPIRPLKIDFEEGRSSPFE